MFVTSDNQDYRFAYLAAMCCLAANSQGLTRGKHRTVITLASTVTAITSTIAVGS